MGAPQEVKVLSIPTLSYPLPTSLPYFLQESLPVCHIHHLVLCNESPPNSIAESAKTKIKLATQVLGSRGGGRSVLIRPSLPSEAKTGDLFHDADYRWQVNIG